MFQCFSALIQTNKTWFLQLCHILALFVCAHHCSISFVSNVSFTNHWHQMYHSYQTYYKSLLRLVEIYSWRMLDFVKVHYYWPESHQDQGQISPKAKINFNVILFERLVDTHRQKSFFCVPL